MNVILSGLIGAILGGLISFRSNKENLNDSLDSKSGWRKQLFDIASKNEIVLDDVYRVRASLRYDKHKNERMIPFSFDWMSNLMIDYCEWLVEKRNCTINIKLTKTESEIIRIFCRYLLKNHWEFRESMGPKSSISKQNYNSRPQEYAMETMNLFVKELEVMKDKIFLKKIREYCYGETNMKKFGIMTKYNINWFIKFLFKAVGILSVLFILSIIVRFTVLNKINLGELKIFSLTFLTYKVIWGISTILISLSASFFTTPPDRIMKKSND